MLTIFSPLEEYSMRALGYQFMGNVESSIISSKTYPEKYVEAEITCILSKVFDLS